VPTFAKAYSGFPVELACVSELHAAFLNESRTRECWWRPVQEIRIRGQKTTGAKPPPLLLTRRAATRFSYRCVLRRTNQYTGSPAITNTKPGQVVAGRSMNRQSTTVLAPST
jgi:hypothetical protein